MKKVDILRRTVATLKKDKNISQSYSQNNVEEVIEAYSKTVMKILKENPKEKIPIFGLGAFKTKHIDSKIRCNFLKGGERYTSSAKDKLVFIPSAMNKIVKEY